MLVLLLLHVLYSIAALAQQAVQLLLVRVQVQAPANLLSVLRVCP
jgi:hypothetical protein